MAFQHGPAEPDMGLFETLKSILVEKDSKGIPVPFVLPGVTDARLMSKLGIQTYGFLPMQLPDDFNIAEKLHGVDERIPVDAMEFGTSAILQLLQRFGEAK
jgi:acetylornithine deacetylase/succinyl-diaminopimelate desuccinylase-like protein